MYCTQVECEHHTYHTVTACLTDTVETCAVCNHEDKYYDCGMSIYCVC